jgi:molybdopterin-guanine dinucleotide biosynthesis protein A
MTLTTVLFTGGLSSRMGMDKATLQIGGEPLWSRQLRILEELQPQALWISARSRPAWCPPDIEVVEDAPPSRGPLSGLVASLNRVRTSHLLVLAVDLPQMTTEHLGRLWSMAGPGVGVIPRHGDNFEPLCAIYPAGAAAPAAAALDSNNLCLQNFAQALLAKSKAQVYGLASDERALHLNMNTRFDFLALDTLADRGNRGGS